MNTNVTIALDAMGGDIGPSVVVPAAISYLQKHPDVQIVLVGLTESIEKELNGFSHSNLTIQHATEIVGMDEAPSRALRGKKDSSMRVAINLVKEQKANACVSAGNTGALMATGRFVLKTIQHIDRPAIISALPTIHGHTWMLDLGANVDSSADHLFQFAVMAAELVGAVDGKPSPTVGLLNIGEEEIKGNEQVKQAHKLLSTSSLNYIGYVEGDDIYTKQVDVVVSDGFVGNVALKASEGVAKMVRHALKEEFSKNWLNKLRALVAMPVLTKFRASMDPREYNGATLLGLQGLVIKSHGGADQLAFYQAIKMAHEEVVENVAERIALQVEQQLAKDKAS